MSQLHVQACRDLGCCMPDRDGVIVQTVHALAHRAHQQAICGRDEPRGTSPLSIFRLMIRDGIEGLCAGCVTAADSTR